MEKMTKLTNEDNVQAEMANHDKHYWAIVQGLKRKRKDAHDLAEMIGEGSTVALAIWNKYVDFDFTKRMAEGAAGEASPLDYRAIANELAEGVLEKTPRMNHLATWPGTITIAAAIMEGMKRVSGSASTAGPRPRCPKCEGTDLILSRMGSTFQVDCRNENCGKYWEIVDEYPTQLNRLAQFFAAAPAESTRPKNIVANVNVDAFLAAIGIDTSKGNGLGLEWEPRYIATKAFELCNSAPEDVQLDVELEKRITEIRKRLSKVAEGPWFTSSDDASDSPDHKDSGLAMVDTGRSSEWPIARLCEWQNARFIEHAILDIPFLLEQLALLRRVSGKGAEVEAGDMQGKLIGTLLDAWDGIDNDFKSVVLDQYPSLHDSMQELYKAVESGDFWATTQGTPEGAK